MNPLEHIGVHATPNPFLVHEPEKQETEEAAIIHVQSTVDKEHAEAQFKIFSCTTPSHLVTVQAIPEETLKKITACQKRTVDHVVLNSSALVDEWIACIVADPLNRLPKAQEIAKALEKELKPENREIYKLIADSAKTQLINYKKRFIKLDNAVDIIEVALRITLHRVPMVEYCIFDIKTISPEYLRQLALTSEHVQAKETKEIDVIFKPQAIPEEKLTEITKALKYIVSCLNAERPLEYLVQDPTKHIPEAKKNLKEWEKEFDPETAALFTLLANAAKAPTLHKNRAYPFIILDNIDEIVELAVKWTLCSGDKIKNCATRIRKISPEYLQQLGQIPNF